MHVQLFCDVSCRVCGASAWHVLLSVVVCGGLFEINLPSWIIQYVPVNNYRFNITISQTVSIGQLLSFISEYIKKQLDKDVT